jgi:hypothetical protein
MITPVAVDRPGRDTAYQDRPHSVVLSNALNPGEFPSGLVPLQAQIALLPTTCCRPSSG